MTKPTRNMILVLLVLLLSACGGEDFSTEFDAVGGDTGGDVGEPPVVSTGGSATAGTPSVGGAVAGDSMGGDGGATAGSPSAGAPVGGGGAAPIACGFDVANLTAALPATLTWSSFELGKNGMCAACAFDPCASLKVTWGDPVVNGSTVTYRASYAPANTVPMTLRVASSNSCGSASYGMCNVRVTPSPISLTVTQQDSGWVVNKAAVTVWFSDDGCPAGAGNPDALVEQMNLDLQAEIAPLLTNLKIPCN